MLQPNVKYQADAERLLACLPDNGIHTAFFDPQYRGILDKLDYGNEGERQKGRAELPQMDEAQIRRIVSELGRILAPMGHLFLWTDKFHLCEGIAPWTRDLGLETVDLITWDKGRIGMGYRTRRRSEYLVVLQKPPKRAKGVWNRRDIPDVWDDTVWQEKMPRGQGHAHSKPYGLIHRLIEATVPADGIVCDPAAGSFAVYEAAQALGRRFIGGDLVFGDTELTAQAAVVESNA